jgi:N-methylhydantoinase B
MRCDQTMVSYSNGGGGFGDPRARDPERVAYDVSEGWISATRAVEVYGAVLDLEGAVDVAATAAKRSALRRQSEKE